MAAMSKKRTLALFETVAYRSSYRFALFTSPLKLFAFSTPKICISSDTRLDAEKSILPDGLIYGRLCEVAAVLLLLMPIDITKRGDKMFKEWKWTIAIGLGLLTGCADMGRVGFSPKLKETFVSASVERTWQCLDAQATANQLRLEEDGPLPGGSRRFNLLNQDGEVVAWLDISAFNKQSDIDMFYGKDDKQTESQLMVMVKQCQQELN